MDHPIKIALVSAFDYAFPGGINDHIRNLAIQFNEWGHSVYILAPCSTQDNIHEPNFIPMGKPVPIPGSGSIARVSLSVLLRPRIKKLLEEKKFDIIHVHNPFAGFLTANVLSLSGAVNIATFHGFGSPGLGYQIIYKLGASKIAKKYFKKLDGLIAVSEPAREFISNYFPGDYKVIPNGIRLESYTDNVKPFAHLKDGMINLLFVGRLEKRKGLKYLLAAYRRIKWDFPNIRLIIVGPGKPDQDSQRIINEGNLKDVIFVGPVSDEDKIRYYKTADIFCSPATGQESFGIVLLEAMAARKPIIATSIEGYSSVITNGIDGILVPPKNDYALADAIKSLLNTPKLLDTISNNGHKKVEQFQWNKIAKSIMDMYISCLNSKVNARNE